MKSEQEIYQDYIKYNHNRPWFFGKQAHWLEYLDTYQFAEQKAIEDRDRGWWKTLGMDIENHPTDTDKQIQVMRDALQAYYKSKK